VHGFEGLNKLINVVPQSANVRQTDMYASYRQRHLVTINELKSNNAG
jgi:hypothetical protein